MVSRLKTGHFPDRSTQVKMEGQIRRPLTLIGKFLEHELEIWTSFPEIGLAHALEIEISG